MKVFLFAIFLTSFKLMSSEWLPISKERAAELVIKKTEHYLDYKNGDVIKWRMTTNNGEGCIWTYENSDTILLDYKVERKSYFWNEQKWGYSDGISNASYCEERYGNVKGSRKRLDLVTHRNMELNFIKQLLNGELGHDYEYNSELNKIRFFFPQTKELGIKSIYNLSGNDQTFEERMVWINNTSEKKSVQTYQAWIERGTIDIEKLYNELKDEKVYMDLYYLKGSKEYEKIPLGSSKNYYFEIPNETFGKILSGNSKGK
jgi:hypothetical protein